MWAIILKIDLGYLCRKNNPQEFKILWKIPWYTSSGSTENVRGNPHLMPRVRFHPIFGAQAHIDRQNGVISKILNRNQEDITELGSIQVSNHISLHFIELRSDWKVPRKLLSHALSSFPFHFPTTGPSRSPIWGPSGNFQPETPLHRPDRIQLRNFPWNLHGPFWAHTQLPPTQTSIMFTQPNSCFKIYPKKPPSTNPSYHPHQSPTITPSIRPTPTPSH